MGTLKQSRTKVNKNASPAEPNHNKDESKDLINPVVSPDDSQDLGAKAAAPVSKVSNPFPNQGDPKKIKYPAHTVITKEDVEIDLEPLRNAFDAEGLDLSEAFYQRIQSILEEPLRAKIEEISEEISDVYAAAFAEELNELNDTLEERVDSVLGHICEEWQENNQLAIEYGIRNELTESFIDGLRGLFESHYIEVPDERFDILEDMENTIEELKGDFSKLYEDNFELKRANEGLYEQLEIANKREIILDESYDLSETDKEKLMALSEGFMDLDVNSFKRKVSNIKENHFPKYKEVNYLTEDLDETEYLGEDTIDPGVASVASMLL